MRVLIQEPNIIAALAGRLEGFDNRLRSLCDRCNSGIAGTSPELFSHWNAELETWYRELCPLAAVLIKAGFTLPPDTWHSGDSSDRLAFLNAWALVLPSLRAYFAIGAPVPNETRH
jgi:hypothetical protein